MRHLHATVENNSKKKKKYQRKMKNTNAASLRPQVTRMKKKNPFVRHGSSGPLENKKKVKKKSDE